MGLKEQATHLRKEGLSYKQISEELNVSIDWCKRNLKGIKKEEHQDKALSEAINKSLQDGGIDRYELVGILLSHYSKEEVDKMNIPYYKQKMRRVHPEAIIRPSWMDKNSPSDSNLLMMELASSIYERMEEAADDYISCYPNTNRKSLLFEFRKMLGERVYLFAEQNTEVANILETRKKKA